MSRNNYQLFLQDHFLPYINKKFFKRNEFLIIFFTLLFLISFFVIPNNKILFLVSALYFLTIFLTCNSIYKTLLFTFFPLSLIGVGQSYSFLAVPPEAIFANGYSQGRILYYVFSPFSILLFTTLFLFLLEVFKKVFKKKSILVFKKTILIWFLFFFFALIGASQADFLPALSILYLLESFFIFLAFLLIQSYLKRSKDKNSELNLFLLELLIIAIFLNSIVFLQLIKRGTLGIIIERSHSLPLFGAGADQDISLFRPIGIFSHANILANYLNILFFSILFLWIYLLDKKKLYIKKDWIKAVLFFLLFSIFLSLSRAVWLSLTISFIVYVAFFFKDFQEVFKSKFSKFFKLKYFIFLLPLIWNLVLRVVYSLNSFSDTGAIPVRRKLFKESLMLLRRNFLFGVGKGMFIPTLFKENPSGIIQEFPEAIHNGLMLNLIENGFLAFLAFLIFYYLFFRQLFTLSFFKKKKKLLLISVLGVLSQLIVSLFHPFTNIINLYTFVLLLLVYEEMA